MATTGAVARKGEAMRRGRKAAMGIAVLGAANLFDLMETTGHAGERRPGKDPRPARSKIWKSSFSPPAFCARTASTYPSSPNSERKPNEKAGRARIFKVNHE